MLEIDGMDAPSEVSRRSGARQDGLDYLRKHDVAGASSIFIGTFIFILLVPDSTCPG